MAHTPGPYYVVHDKSQQDEFGNGPTGVAISLYEDDPTDALAWMGDFRTEEARDGTADLFAAAPDLLEALESIAEYWNGDANETAMADACQYAIDTAQAAIKKAKGGE